MNTPHSFSVSRFIFVAGLLSVLISCHRYFKPIAAKTNSTGESGNLISSYSSQKYFILRQGDKSMALKNVTVDKTSMTLSGTLAPVDPSHRLYINARGDNYKYRQNSTEDENGLSGTPVLAEIHIYINNAVALDAAKPFIMPLDQVVKIEVIEHDRKRTRSSYILGGVGIGLGVLVIAGVIIAATKTSCPFVSAYDGEQYQLQGELFGGAVNRQLERTDYVPLNISPIAGEFRLRISNELKERQYTNFADLLVIEHPENTEAFVDYDGKIYQVAHPVAPDAARLNGRLDVLNSVKTRDEVYCSFNDTTGPAAINEMTLSFNRQGVSGQAKLLLHLKNSYWFDYLFGEFTRNFGSRYESWQHKQQKRPAEQMTRWTEEQKIPLGISIQTKKGWQDIRQVKTIGPLASRTLIIPVDLDQAAGVPLQLKLTTGFLFWEVDYAAMDFSADRPVTVTRVSPSTAEDEKGNSVLAELAADDNRYLSQPEAGKAALLSYPYTRQPGPGQTYSVVLYTKGYYEPVREYSGKPNKAVLKKFREPGELAKFSLSRYRAIPKEHTVIALHH